MLKTKSWNRSKGDVFGASLELSTAVPSDVPRSSLSKVELKSMRSFCSPRQW